MYGPMTDAYAPYLRVRNPRIQLVRCGERVYGDFVIAGLDVDGHDLAFVAGFNARANVALIQLLSALREFLHTIAGLMHEHRFAPEKGTTRISRYPYLIIRGNPL